MTTSITFTHPSAADSLWVVRDRIRFLGEMPSTDLDILEVEVFPGAGTPPHRHPSAEVFRVLSGELTFGTLADGKPVEQIATPGALVTVPSGAVHYYRNHSASPATVLVFVDRAMTAFFRDLGRKETPPAGPPSESEITAVLSACARHHIVIER